MYPVICHACSRVLAGNEEFLCTLCRQNLPETGYWKYTGNPVEKLFWGRINFENASAYLFFEKGSGLQHLMHRFKYKGKKDIGYFLGRQFGKNLKNTPLSNVDLIIPVPLHKKKQTIRGFNQSEVIAQGIASELGVPVNAVVAIRQKANRSQTRKNRYDRWLNSQGLFQLQDSEFIAGKHVLVVDDIITTGATAESFAQVLMEVPGVKISFVALAVA